jgi:hypothetical protein
MTNEWYLRKRICRTLFEAVKIGKDSSKAYFYRKVMSEISQLRELLTRISEAPSITEARKIVEEAATIEHFDPVAEYAAAQARSAERFAAEQKAKQAAEEAAAKQRTVEDARRKLAAIDAEAARIEELRRIVAEDDEAQPDNDY